MSSSRRVVAAVAITSLVLAVYGLAYAQPPEELPEPVEPPQSQALPEEAVEGQAEGEARHAAAEAHAEAIQAWTGCVAEAAAAQGDEELRQPEPFDPTAGCGEKPEPPGDGVDDSVGVTQGPPEGPPSGPPEGTPSGPPEGNPSGPPEGTPNGPPEG